MNNTLALDTLIKLAKKNTDEAAKRLGVACQKAEEAEQKLALLAQYQQDYLLRFEQNLHSGLSAVACSNYRQFIVKLDEATRNQQSAIYDARQKMERERTIWQACEQKRLSYTLLAERSQKMRQTSQMRHEQKQMDEYAARRLLSKPSITL